MNIKRFSAPDMRHALGQIRDELGPDAVILETNKTPDGVEVSAAIDFDPALYIAPGSVDRRPEERVAERRPEKPDSVASDTYAKTIGSGMEETGRARTAVNGHAAEPDWQAAPASAADESVRCMLEARLSRLIWDDMRSRNPAATNIMRNFSRLGLTADVVEHILADAGDLSELDNSWSKPLTWLTDSIPVATSDLIMGGGVFAIAGPTGVGKTTSIAKLAARFALRNGIEDIALVSTDNYRIGAREQLETFARILGVPVYSVPDAAKLDATLAGLSDKRLVLIDTAGMGQRDMRMVEQLSSLRQSNADIQILLAMPANVQTETILEIIDVFAASKPVACILTKVDEATSLGGAISGLIRANLPLAYICDGQRVPEDVHLGVQRVGWLVKSAVDCMRNHSPRISKDEMAERFVKVAVNA